MSNLLMISGDRSLAEGKRGAFYGTLEEFHKFWDRIDVICPRVNNQQIKEVFGNVFIHSSSWPLIFQPLWILREGLRILKTNGYSLMANNYLMTVHEFPPFYNGIGARLLWNRIKVPYVLEIFHVPGHPRTAGIKEVIYKFLFKLFVSFDVSKAKAVRVMNQKQVSDFLVKAGVPKNKIVYIPAIYVDLNIFKPMDLPKEYDLIFVGRLVKNKGINLLLDAANKLKAQILNFKLLIVGNGSLKNNLKFKIKNLKLQDNILLHGWAKDSREIAELLNKSKVLVMPSYNEGGPRVVVEAVACGVPVLATPVGIVPDLLKNGLGGEIIAWEADDIARRVLGLLNDPDKYQRYSHSGPEMAIQFERRSTIKNYAEKLKSLI